MNIIFTCQTDSSELCLEELMRADRGARFARWLGDGIGMLKDCADFKEFSSALRESRPIFTRHIFPAQYELEHEGTLPSKLAGLFSAQMAEGQLFAVQARGFGGSGFSEALSGELCAAGFLSGAQVPEQVVSLVLSGGTIYAGLSTPCESLSGRTGGMVHYARYEGQISRAEFKLLEAIEVFSLSFKDEGLALDLGAAPGGWSQVLMRMGASVVAVDPGNMARELLEDGGLEHFRGTAQDFMVKDSRRFNAIVNDMRMDVEQSARIMADLRDRLEPDGVAVMTFKLPAKKRMSSVNRGLAILRGYYRELSAKQLFHNRSEITVVMKP